MVPQYLIAVSRSFATRTKNVENKPIINERGVCTCFHHALSSCSDNAPLPTLDNRPTAKPHFAAPPAPKPAPTILQPITTAASSSSTSGPAVVAAGRARASLGPSGHAYASRVPRVSAIGLGGAGYQRFALPGGGRRLLDSVDEKAAMTGFGALGMTEKDIEEKVRVYPNFTLIFLVIRFRFGRVQAAWVRCDLDNSGSWHHSLFAEEWRSLPRNPVISYLRFCDLGCLAQLASNPTGTGALWRIFATSDSGRSRVCRKAGLHTVMTTARSALKLSYQSTSLLGLINAWQLLPRAEVPRNLTAYLFPPNTWNFFVAMT